MAGSKGSALGLPFGSSRLSLVRSARTTISNRVETHADPNDRPGRPLRRGWTTGSCATAGAKAAYAALLTGAFPDPVEVTLPNGHAVAFSLAESALADYCSRLNLQVLCYRKFSATSFLV